jgi:hypothetical protein
MNLEDKLFEWFCHAHAANSILTEGPVFGKKQMILQ